MSFVGEILALAVAVLWTISSLASEPASKRFGSLLLNIVRMLQTILILGVALWAMTGSPIPMHTDSKVWWYLSLSSLAGYIIGDFFFLQCFILIGARWGELFMTIAPLAAALTGWAMLGEKMSGLAWVGMCITTLGISLSVLSKKDDDTPSSKHLHVKLPLKGIIYGLIAGIGQGVGLVFSKQGMLYYQANIEALEGYSISMPFAATMIRCVVALAGFSAMYAMGRMSGKETHAVRLIWQDHKAHGLATLSTITGPCLGVSISLAATMFTSTGITQTIMSLVPVLILWPSHLLFHTKITAMEVVGAIISVAGVALFFL